MYLHVQTVLRFYFMNLLQTVGVMALVFGMQITFEAERMAEMVDVFDTEKLTEILAANVTFLRWENISDPNSKVGHVTSNYSRG